MDERLRHAIIYLSTIIATVSTTDQLSRSSKIETNGERLFKDERRPEEVAKPED